MADLKVMRSVACALVITEFGILVGPAPIRVVAGLTLGLILPGLVITPVLCRPRIEGAERLLLVPGVSLVIAVITGLVLNAAHVHLTRENWAIALGVVTAVGLAIVAALDRNTRSSRYLEPDSRLPLLDGTSVGRLRLPGVTLGVMGAIGALAGTGALLISAAGEHYRGAGFSELWSLPGQGSRSAVRIGVISHELHDTRYRIEVSIDGREARTERITLQPGQSWQSAQPVPRRDAEVQVRLQRLPSGAVYRQVHVLAGQLSG